MSTDGAMDMTVTRTASPIGPQPATAIDFPATAWENHMAQFEARWGAGGLVLAVRGEIDAANADHLVECVRQCTPHCQWLVLDFGDLEFMGTAGFAALQHIESLADGEMQWTMVPSAAVSRLLGICDPETALPRSATMTEALGFVEETRVLRLLG